MSQIEDRLESIARFTERQDDVLALRGHMRDLLDSPSFSGSQRSGQFLRYVVEHALRQHKDALKERTIGVEVFHRSPDYDTGEDAIVRVTASDVRRRLAQHYGGSGRSSDFRIRLPPGGYVPEIGRTVCEGSDRIADSGAAAVGSPEITEAARTPESDAMQPSCPPEQLVLLPREQQRAAVPHFESVAREPWQWAADAAFLLATLVIAGTLLVGSNRPTERAVPEPWAKLFGGGQTVAVVLADPDLNEIQKLTHRYVPLSDYANGELGCNTLQPELQTLCKDALRGDKVAEVDAAAVARISQIAGQFRGHVEPHAARSLRLPELQGERNIVILGSKVSNPWADLYRGRTDFYIDHDEATGLQVVRNQHPHGGESAVYLPTAGPYGTGENYALISLVRNLSGGGYALLLAGCTHEGMEAAVAAMLDRPNFEKTINACGITDKKPFQVLMRVHMMAGSSLTAERLACHQLN